MTIASRKRDEQIAGLGTLAAINAGIEENTDMKVLNDLNDVNVNAPDDKQLLEYDASDEQWKAGGHTIVNHNDTTATGAELEELTGGSETTLHSHAAEGGITYTDKGDVAAYDYQTGNLTKDNAWHALDLSVKIGAGERLVLLRVIINSINPDGLMLIRTNGSSNEFNITTLATKGASKDFPFDVWVKSDSSGIIEYKLSSGEWPTINVTVSGYITL